MFFLQGAQQKSKRQWHNLQQWKFQLYVRGEKVPKRVMQPGTGTQQGYATSVLAGMQNFSR